MDLRDNSDDVHSSVTTGNRGSSMPRLLFSSVLIASGIALLIVSSAFLLSENPAEGGGPRAVSAQTIDSILILSAPDLAAPTASLEMVSAREALATATPIAATPTPATAVPSAPIEVAAPVEPQPTATPHRPTPVPPTAAPAAPVPPQAPVIPPPTATPVPPPPPPPPPAPAPSVALTAFEADILAGMNAERVAVGLPALQLDGAITAVARERSNDMIGKGYFGHDSPTGENAFTLMDKYGIPYGWAGENLARNNYPDNEAVAVSMRDWMASQGHRDNILSPHYSLVGVGAGVDSTGMKYFTVVFVGF